MIFFELFYTFFYIGLLTFGGGYAMIPMIEDEIVSKGWINSESLLDFIAISEGTPGPFAINIATMVGSETGGFFGAVCATIGVVLPSFIIILLVAFLIKKILKNRFVKAGLNGVIPTIIALISATAIIFFIKTVLYQGNNINATKADFDRPSFTIIILLLVFTLICKLKNKKSPNPLLILLLGGIMGLIVFI